MLERYMGRLTEVHHYLMKTDAWRTLKPGPRALLTELYALYNGDNNGAIFLSEREAAKRINVSKLTARRYFLRLVERGFVKSHHKGSFNVKAPVATTWILTEFGYSGKLPTKDFTKWSEKQNTGIKNILGGYKNYTSAPENTLNLSDTGIKISPVRAVS